MCSYPKIIGKKVYFLIYLWQKVLNPNLTVTESFHILDISLKNGKTLQKKNLSKVSSVEVPAEHLPKKKRIFATLTHSIRDLKVLSELVRTCTR
jgi:hypothetical protein